MRAGPVGRDSRAAIPAAFGYIHPTQVSFVPKVLEGRAWWFGREASIPQRRTGPGSQVNVRFRDAGVELRTSLISANQPSPGRTFDIHRADASAQLPAWGRPPDACKVLFCVSFVLGETVEEAAERTRRRRARLAAALSFFGARDLSRLPMDEPVQRARPMRPARRWRPR